MERRKSGLSEDEIDDCLSLNPEFRKSLKKARREVAKGEYMGLEELESKKEKGIRG